MVVFEIHFCIPPSRVSPSGVVQSNRRSRLIYQAIRNCFVLIDKLDRPVTACRSVPSKQPRRQRFARGLFRSECHVKADLVKSTGNFCFDICATYVRNEAKRSPDQRYRRLRPPMAKFPVLLKIFCRKKETRRYRGKPMFLFSSVKNTFAMVFLPR